MHLRLRLRYTRLMVNITIIDVGRGQAGFGGTYTAAMCKLKKVFGAHSVKGACGYGYDMDQAMFVLCTVGDARRTLGDMWNKSSQISVRRATGVKLDGAKYLFGMVRCW